MASAKHDLLPGDSLNNSLLEHLFGTSNTKSKYQALIELKGLEAKNATRDWGLGLNVYGAIRQQEDLVLGGWENYFTPRLRTEIEWATLKDGLLENKARAKQKTNEQQILLLQKADDEKKEWLKQFRLNYQYAINQELLALYYKKKILLDLLFDIQHQLYAQKRILRSEILNTSNEIHVLHTQIDNLEMYTSQTMRHVPAFIKKMQLPFIGLNLVLIRANTEDEQLKYQLANIKNENPWFKSVSLSFYVSYNIDQVYGSHAPYAGFRLRMPLRFSDYKSIEKEKTNLAWQEFYEKKSRLNYQEALFLEAYRERVQDIQTTYNNWTILEEEKRKILVLKEMFAATDEVGVRLIRINAQQLGLGENLLKQKKQLYELAEKLLELNNTNPRHLIEPFAFKHHSQKLVIAAMHEHSAYNASLRIQYLRAKGFTHVVLSEPVDEQLKKALLDNGFTLLTNSLGQPVTDIDELIKSDFEVIGKQRKH